tara:strand:- start:1604 stop:1792 length:189 start_codon:yes stop_codon:yes gene_type:complete
MITYTVRQIYTAQDVWKNVKAKDKQQAIDICMGGRAIDETRHEDTYTEVEEVKDENTKAYTS